MAVGDSAQNDRPLGPQERPAPAGTRRRRPKFGAPSATLWIKSQAVVKTSSNPSPAVNRRICSPSGCASTDRSTHRKGVRKHATSTGIDGRCGHWIIGASSVTDHCRTRFCRFAKPCVYSRRCTVADHGQLFPIDVGAASGYRGANLGCGRSEPLVLHALQQHCPRRGSRLRRLHRRWRPGGQQRKCRRHLAIWSNGAQPHRVVDDRPISRHWSPSTEPSEGGLRQVRQPQHQPMEVRSNSRRASWTDLGSTPQHPNPVPWQRNHHWPGHVCDRVTQPA